MEYKSSGAMQNMEYESSVIMTSRGEGREG
jgi:hypothetical protein